MKIYYINVIKLPFPYTSESKKSLNISNLYPYVCTSVSDSHHVKFYDSIATRSKSVLK